MRENSGSKMVNVASIKIRELTEAELDTIAGGLDGLQLLSRAMGGSTVVDNLWSLTELYQNRK